MALVDYSSDTSSEAPTPPQSPKVSASKAKDAEEELPPLPAVFHTLYTTTPRRSTSDDPSLHENRQRQIPHLPGYYPSHAYLEWYPTTAQLPILETFIDIATRQLNLTSLLHSSLGADLPLHLSLSRPCILAREERTRFVDILTTSLKLTRKFSVEFTGLDWVVNENSTRWFYVLKARVNGGSSEVLEDIVRKTNRAFAVFNQPPLPCEGFHVSLAWTLEEPPEKAKRIIEDEFRGERYRLKELEVEIEDIRIKIGNEVKRIQLK